MKTAPFVTLADLVDAYNAAADERGEPGIDVRTVRREIARGHLAGQKVGTTWLVPEKAAVAWLHSYRRYQSKNGRRDPHTRRPSVPTH